VDNRQVIASSLLDNALARALSNLVAERWDDFDLSPFMVYLVDTCAAEALPYLAEQFDIDGLQGFAMAATEQQKRDLIKRSIALHKFMGTPWAIREACRTIGFPVIILEEGVPAVPGGETSPEDWARFSVLVEADATRHITEEEARKLRLFVEYYKNERSHLVTLGFYQSLPEKLFRPEETDRSELSVFTLSIIPNPIILSRGGVMKKTTVVADVEWIIDHTEYEWDDGSGDIIRLEFTGVSGESEIKVTSDPYTPRNRAYASGYSQSYGVPANRKKIIDIKTAGGLFYGTLTVWQRSRWFNAYSRAYSRAYNIYSGSYVRLDTESVFLPQIDPSAQIQINSNTNWHII
jgi:phage tail P2-like protein